MVTSAKISLAVLATAAAGLALPAVAAMSYPTNAVAEYVYACMKANGENRANLDRCSCSIDVIESIISYERYEAAAGSPYDDEPQPAASAGRA